MVLPRVVVIGGGFGGLQVVRGLRDAPVQVTLIDRRNHYLFQPLLYQVATGGLSPANISTPFRALVKKQRNTRVFLGEVQDIDMAGREVVLAGCRHPYDVLVVATGSQPNYFGHDQWMALAPTLKVAEDAISIRNRVLSAFEIAEREPAGPQRESLLTFVIIGGGATGVELAGALGELKGQTLRGNFRNIDPSTARVFLLEAADRILPTFPAGLSDRAVKELKRLDVTVCTQSLVTDIQPGVVTARVRDTSDVTMRAETILWTAGIKGSFLGQRIARSCQGEVDRNGRVVVDPDLTIPGHPEVFIVGDLACCRHQTDKPLPAVSPVAMQQGRYVAHLIQARLRGKSRPPFRYKDHGSMATIGRGAAVADLRKIQFDGWLGWLAWLFVHLLYILQFENKLLILIQWAWNYFTRNRSARLITGRFEEPCE
ncbi:MAG: NADH dehydrogenase [Phycisphaerae bacterium]|nr:NADH dehydrogenase [Phycisphaerae bacterium]